MCEMRALKQRLWRAEHELGLQGNNSTRTAVMYAEPIVYGTGLDDLPRFICVGVCDVTGWPVGAGNSSKLLTNLTNLTRVCKGHNYTARRSYSLR